MGRTLGSARNRRHDRSRRRLFRARRSREPSRTARGAERADPQSWRRWRARRARARIEMQRGAALDVAERAALYQSVAAADLARLKRLTREAAALQSSPGRTFALEALLARYAEIDARAAVKLGRELEARASAARCCRIAALGDRSETRCSRLWAASTTRFGPSYRPRAVAHVRQ